MNIKIYNVWKELNLYIDAIETGANPIEAWENLVIKPYWEKLVCYAPMDLNSRKPKAIVDTMKLSNQLELLKKIDMDCLKKEFDKVINILPNFDDDPITVVLFPLDDDNENVKIKQNGVIGTALFGNLIIQINPFAIDYEKWIPYVFAHEWHHTVYGNYWFVLNRGKLPDFFISSLLIDGEADSFALSIYESLKPQWLFDLSENEIETLWESRYKSISLKKDVDYSQYMFGNNNDIPWCGGYKVGYYLVQKYIKQQKIKITDVLTIHPFDILEKINYIFIA